MTSAAKGAETFLRPVIVIRNEIKSVLVVVISASKVEDCHHSKLTQFMNSLF